MPEPRTSPVFIALGSPANPFLIVDQDPARLVRALESIDGSRDAVTVFDSDGFPIGAASEDPTALLSSVRTEEGSPAPVPDADTKQFYARVASVLAALASEAASIASGDRKLLDTGLPLAARCSCFWCHFGVQC
ncbi:MAG TPA: hypothetical protein VGK51_10630 [Actinomycetota bacterium]